MKVKLTFIKTMFHNYVRYIVFQQNKITNVFPIDQAKICHTLSKNYQRIFTNMIFTTRWY